MAQEPRYEFGEPKHVQDVAHRNNCDHDATDYCVDVAFVQSVDCSTAKTDAGRDAQNDANEEEGQDEENAVDGEQHGSFHVVLEHEPPQVQENRAELPSESNQSEVLKLSAETGNGNTGETSYGVTKETHSEIGNLNDADDDVPDKVGHGNSTVEGGDWADAVDRVGGQLWLAPQHPQRSLTDNGSMCR
eukprot:CAMPEP_0175916640 /NCGR_PEP_ID=MMETSP0108-20121206/10952_1 /TAXON_ID=195067 ORGANISM="Goniomonas pacifica, Strain CCMP1869" /NCGR_SAMPLE_ID=MMETSP0108 /ASSEMBLY_ACC=CAM_ASM_000204 /LENGTH=188 /DNA_ID=CAMNT_0017239201 /DNA_START=56 /DNA_END=622 /DNA_ORIENTATION=-